MKKIIINVDSLPAKRLKQFGFGASKKETKELRPTFAFLYEFASGKPPAETGVWMDFVLSESSPYNFLKFCKDFKVHNRGLVKRKVLMLLAKLFSRRAYNPHSIPSGLLTFFDQDKVLLSRMQEAPELLKRKYGARSFKMVSGKIEVVEKRVLDSSENLVFANYSELDYIGHIFGPNSEEYKGYTERIFESIERILKTGKFDEVQIMNDHGMYEIKDYIEVLPLLEGLEVGKDFVFFINSPMLRFWVFNEKARERIIENLDAIKKYGRVLGDKDYKEFSFPKDRRFGDIIFWLYRGNHFVPDFFWGWQRIKGMHGYLEWDTLSMSNNFKIYDNKSSKKNAVATREII